LLYDIYNKNKKQCFINCVHRLLSSKRQVISWAAYSVAHESWFGAAVTAFVTSTNLSYVEPG